MPADPKTLYRLIVEIRGAFHDLAEFSSAANADLAITAAMRAVMEYLDGNGAEAVPNIARAKNVSRQHIQQLADALVETGLAKWKDNPRHKRSALLTLTAEGKKRFAEIRRREARALAEIAAKLDETDIQTASDAVSALRAVVNERQD
ncbi:MAG: MarR family winged helix-turn-helix transcriptional regulator [Rhizobiaceae bacterium]